MPRLILVDLPLERFLQPTSDNINLPTPRTGSKRSRSPSFPSSIFTPAKRRILEQEGLFPPPQSRPYPNASTHPPHPRRTDLFNAFDSPKGALGTSSLAAAGLSDDTLPLPPCHPHALVPPLPCESRRISPRLSTSPRSKSPNGSPNDATPRGRTRTSPRKTRSQTLTPTHAASSSQRVRPTPTSMTTHTSMSPTATPSPTTPRTITLIPREMPPPPDRRSVHYPGFDVHQDTHLALPCTRSKTRAKAEAARVRELEGDAAKENVRPVPTFAPSPSNGNGKPEGKGKGDVAPRRSARLRRNSNSGGCAPSSQKGLVVPADARVHGRRRNTLHHSSLQF
ncbi:hypothetical protein BC827DRAFT_1181486 [Russula dissimulans]|nr:hypothetical protein BC827DRAFT_1181486 [Russula dissimulans]